jgi:hypothetical protein
MAAWTLSAEQWDALDEIRFGTTDKTVFRNATVILMSAVGRSKFSIAHDLGCSPATVDNIRKHYRQHGAAGLKPRKPPGRTSAATPAYRQALREVVNTPPHWLPPYSPSLNLIERLWGHLKPPYPIIQMAIDCFPIVRCVTSDSKTLIFTSCTE